MSGRIELHRCAEGVLPGPVDVPVVTGFGVGLLRLAVAAGVGDRRAPSWFWRSSWPSCSRRRTASTATGGCMPSWPAGRSRPARSWCER